MSGKRDDEREAMEERKTKSLWVSKLSEIKTEQLEEQVMCKDLPYSGES